MYYNLQKVVIAYYGFPYLWTMKILLVTTIIKMFQEISFHEQYLEIAGSIPGRSG